MVKPVANKRTPIYCRALVIAHGASEYQIASYIKSKLRLPMEISARDSGRHSIQINSLMAWLNKKFPTQARFMKENFNVQSDGKSLVDFVVFPIMDTDDCEPRSLSDDFKNKTLFDEHWFKPYVHPIYNTPSLEHILFNTGIIDKMLPDNEKTETYRRIFPIDKNAPKDTGKKDIEEFRDRVSQAKNTNITEFIDYCLAWAESNRIDNQR